MATVVENLSGPSLAAFTSSVIPDPGIIFVANAAFQFTPTIDTATRTFLVAPIIVAPAVNTAFSITIGPAGASIPTTKIRDVCLAIESGVPGQDTIPNAAPQVQMRQPFATGARVHPLPPPSVTP